MLKYQVNINQFVCKDIVCVPKKNIYFNYMLIKFEWFNKMLMLIVSANFGVHAGNFNMAPQNLNTIDQGVSFVCSACNKSYQHWRSRWRHQKFECGKTPNFECYICKLKFSRKDTMRKHIFLMHSVAWN